MDLSDDLLVEILMRLPLKSLCRFKCVSKSWYQLISGNYLQQRLPLIATGLFFRSTSDQYPKVKYAYPSANGTIQDCNLDFFPFCKKSKMVHGSNGLLLYYSPAYTTFFVVNTATKSWVSLPRPHEEATQDPFLAFDPYNSADFKVVWFTDLWDEGAKLEIYSSKTGKWDQHEVQFGVGMLDAEHYFDGLLYLLAFPNMVVTLDLTKFSCNLIRLPESMTAHRCVFHCQGRLHYAHIRWNKLKIWMMSYLNKGEWELKYVVNLNKIIGTKVFLDRNSYVLLAFHPEKDLVCVCVHKRVVCYDLKEKRCVESWKLRGMAYMIRIWLFPYSRFLTNHLA